MRGRINRSAPKRDAATAIPKCISYDRMCEDARLGSLALLNAIESAGLRP